MRVWVIDTGAIVEIRRGLPTIVRGRVLRMLDARVNDGSLIFPPEVVDELQRMTDEISKKGVDLPYDWRNGTRNKRQDSGTCSTARRP